MAGEYDDQLEWPFVGKIDIEILNWREDKGHHKMTMSIVDSNGFAKVKEGDFGESGGYVHFITHSSLAYTPMKNTVYLLEDCLRFRIKLSV